MSKKLTKPEIIDKLTAAGIEHDPAAKVDSLRALLPEEEVGTNPGTTIIDGIEVGDPQILRPKELPLVVKPADGGEWKNEAQAKFAKVINAYAYKNPEKWATKKGVLLKQLAELGTNPGLLYILEGGGDQNLQFKNKIIEQ